MTISETFDARFYPYHSNNWDDSAFRDRILRHLRSGHVVLDIGAGRGRLPQMNFRGIAGHVCGLDPDPIVTTNPWLDEAVVGSAEKIPWQPQTFDLVFSDNVVEHLPNPVAVFREVHRVLKPGGLFLVKTPNRWHYVTLISSLTPYSFHQWVKAKRGAGAADTFPTLYRANTRPALQRVARASGLEAVDITTIEGRPEYMRWNPLAYAAGLLYERAVNYTEWLSTFRIVLLATFRKAPVLSAAEPESNHNLVTETEFS
jgi:SAM-dependent methyltransferase